MNKNDNNGENSIIESEIDFENVKIGHTYIMELKTGAIISGAIIAKLEFFDNNGEIVTAYTVAFSKSKAIDIMENEIERLDLVEHYNENHKSVLQYLEEFQEKYKVKCFNDKGRLLNFTILDNVLTRDRLWDKLPAREKKEFVEKLRITSNEIIGIMDILCKTLKENDKLHDARQRVLDESVKLIGRYKDAQAKYQNINKIYEVFFNDLGIKEFLKVI